MGTISLFIKKTLLVFVFLVLLFGEIFAAGGIQTSFTVSGNTVTVKMKSDIAVSGTFQQFIADFRYLASYNPTFTVTSSNYTPVVVAANIADPNDGLYRLQRFSFTGGSTTPVIAIGTEYTVFSFQITGGIGTGIIGLSMDDPNYVSNPDYTFSTGSFADYLDPYYNDGYLTTSDFMVGSETWWWRTHAVNLGKSWLASAATTDWQTGTNWSDATVPTGSETITVFPGTNQPVAGSGSVCNALSIPAGASVQVDVSGTLTINGDLTVADDNGLLVKSTAAGTGSLITKGTVPAGNKVKVQRYAAAANWALGTDGWHLLSSPVAAQAITGTFAPTGVENDYDFYAWSEPTQTWLNQKTPANLISTFNVGQGYLVAYQQAGTKEFVGTLNTADKAVTLTKSGGGFFTNYGWTLLGNPYSSALTWFTGWGDMTNVGVVAQIWNDAAKDYALISAGSAIPSMNGFMVFTSAATQALTIPEAARTHSSTPWYKSGEKQIQLIARDPEGSSFKTCYIGFNPNATAGFDLDYDAYLLSGFAPKFYSVADNSKFSLNTLPKAENGLVIPFGFVKNASTKFTIELAESIDGHVLYLIDKKTNAMVNLNEKPIYSFTSEEGDNPDRFTIAFDLTVGLVKEKPMVEASAYSVKNKIGINNVTGNTKMDVINVQGQLLNSYKFFSNGNHEISVNLPTGIYIVRLNNGGEMKTMKVFVK